MIKNKSGKDVTKLVERETKQLIAETFDLADALNYTDVLADDCDITEDQAKEAINKFYPKIYPFPRYFSRREGPIDERALYIKVASEDTVFRVSGGGTEEPVAMSLFDCEQYVKDGTWCELPQHIVARLHDKK